MIIIFLCTWLACWSLGVLLRRAARTTPFAPVAPVVPLEQPAARVSPPIGPEDDPAGWPPAVRSDWNDLDERQLIRLLKDSTP